MKIKILTILVWLGILSIDISLAQHGLSNNQFAQLRNNFNSSLSRMDQQGSVSLLGRQQWIGVDGAPRTILASGNIGLSRIGASVGADIKHLALGVTKESEFSAFFAKSVQLSTDSYLSLSLGGGLLVYNADYNSLSSEDPSFRDNIRERAGLLSISTSYYNPDRYYIGISMPRFSLSDRKETLYDFSKVYHLIGGYLWQLDDMIHLRPSFLLSKMQAQSIRYDMNLMAFLGRKFGLGIGLQSQGDLSALMQLNVGDFGFGYSYQFNASGVSASQRLSNNTHEIGIRYRVGGMSLL